MIERKLSERLLDSIDKRVEEKDSGRVLIPTDIKRRVMKELDVPELEARDIIIRLYNGEKLFT